MNTTTSISIDADLLEKFKLLAAAEKRSVSGQIERLIEDALKGDSIVIYDESGAGAGAGIQERRAS